MDEIYQTIPHRPPFLFIDEIVEVTEERAVARRQIRAEEPHFEGHYPGHPIMPGVLLCEAVFQTAAIYLVKKFSREGDSPEGLFPILSRIEEAKFKNRVHPGDAITIEVNFKRTLSQFHFLRGKIRSQDGKLVLTIAFAVAMLEA